MDLCGKVYINEIQIKQRVLGAGEPVLLVHGWGASIELLQPLAQRLSRLGYRCYMFDLPGFGESEEPARAFSVRDYAEFCLAYLDHHQLQRVQYFGHSLGGRIGLLLGAEYPERLRALALSNSAGIRPKPSARAALRLRLYQALRQRLRALGAQTSAEKLAALYAQRYGSADYIAASPIMRQTLVKIVNQDLLPFARRVTLPTILLWGDQDQETPLWMGEALAAAMPDAALIVQPGAGHYAYLDALGKSSAVIDALFRGG